MCATLEQLEMYNSKLYFCILIINLFTIATSLIAIILAFRKLYQDSESVMNFPTRIFLGLILVYVFMHQLAFFVLRLQIIYQFFNILSDPCKSTYTVQECSIITYGLITGNTGIIFIESAMTIDRFIATIFKKFYEKFKNQILLILVAIAIIFDLILINYILSGINYEEQIINCGSLPSESVSRFAKYLEVSFYLSIFLIFMNFLLLFVNSRSEKKIRSLRSSYNVNQRFQSVESLRSSQAIFVVIMVQFLSMLLYSIFTSFYLYIHDKISTLNYGILLSISYTPIYSSLIVPLLIIRMIHHIKQNRASKIKTMTTKHESQEEHMRKMRELWNK
ncbi:unnamed protein product [Caenorhabditis angaria]|uniref:G-protein coupled receptors family 1 profile domain-containing protein n=1 Tax=Caenorhabditis angaria TaxID=860376 RepID=A0A9P1IAD1_9PELO|nr:unnamed protein product [Caenorhabditis angaria]